MFLKYCLCLKLFLIVYINGTKIALIKDHLKLHHLSNCVIFSCDSIEADFQIFKNINSDNYIWLTIQNINKDPNDIDYNRILYSSHLIGVIINLNCKNTPEVLSEISNRWMFNCSYFWLMFDDDVTHSFNILEYENINVDAEITVAIHSSDTLHDFHLYDVYNTNFRRGGKLNVSTLGNWNLETGFNLTMTQNKIDRRANWNGILLHGVLTLSFLPKKKTMLEYLESNDDIHLDTMHRFHYKIFKILMVKYNFTSYVSQSEGWGILLKNGSWTGAVGFLDRRDADIAITPMRYATDRIGVIRIGPVSFRTSDTLIFRHPKSLAAGNIFLEPFHYLVWLCILAVLIVLTIFLHFTIMLNCNILRRISNNSDYEEYSMGSVVILIIGTMMQQGFTSTSAVLSSRVILMVAIIFSFLIYQFYSAFLVGFLLTESPKTITTLPALTNSNLRVGIQNISYNFAFFNETANPEVIDLFKKKITPNKNYFTVEEGMRLMHRGGFAFQVENSIAYKLIPDTFTESEICELQELKLFSKRLASFGLQKWSPFQNPIASHLIRLSETGVLKHYRAEWEYKKLECIQSSVDVSAVDLEHISSILILLIFGAVLSIFIFIIEFALHYLKIKKK